MARTPRDEYSDEEIARRRDELAKHMLNTPPRPLKSNRAKAEPNASPKNAIKRRPKQKERPASKGRVHKGKSRT
jgi:hypothetical protein